MADHFGDASLTLSPTVDSAGDFPGAALSVVVATDGTGIRSTFGEAELGVSPDLLTLDPVVSGALHLMWESGGGTAAAEVDFDPTGVDWDYLGRTFPGATSRTRCGANGGVKVVPPITIYLNTAMTYCNASVAPFVNDYWDQGDFPEWPFEPLPASDVQSQIQAVVPMDFVTSSTEWVRLRFTVNAVLRARTTYPDGTEYTSAGIQMWRGTDYEDIIEVAYPTAGDYFMFVPGVTYLMSVYNASLEEIHLHLTIDPPPFLGEIWATNLEQAPGVVTVSGEDFNVTSPVTVSLVGYPDQEIVTTDAFGDFTVDFDINSGVEVGTYVVSATDGRGTATTNFLVLKPPLVDPPWPDPDPLPTPVGTDWTLFDPLGDLDTFVFPYNPARMSSIHAPVNYAFESTVAQDGSPIIYEGGDVAFEWTFAGILDTQNWHNALLAYAALGHRFWLQDHRGRVWVVNFLQVDMVPHRKVGWLFDYTVTVLVYDVFARISMSGGQP